MDVQGYNGQISFDGATITISREGFWGRVGHGRSEKRIPLSAVGAVQFKPCSLGVAGFVRFSIQGEVAPRTKAGNQARDAAKDDNAVIFTKKQQPEFAALRDAIETARTAPDPTDQLLRLAQLRDAGVLTVDEFEARRASLLDLL